MKAFALRSLATFAALLAALSACEPTTPAVAPPKAPAATKAVSVTILYTADEHGWIQPIIDKESGLLRGGAAEILSHWIAHEGHCPGPGPSGTALGNAACADPPTLLLSGGDNYTGPAISSFYGGEPMAEAMSRMGYAASAFGNHEFDFGREQFLKNRARGGFPYLAANLQVKSDAKARLDIAPYAVFYRRGVKIGVVGIATVTTLIDAAASHFEGMDFSAEEPALDRAITQAWSAGSDAVIVIAHECPDKLDPIVAKHPEWGISFVGAGHCHKTASKMAGKVPILAPGWRLAKYARVRLTIDKSKPARSRVIGVDPEIVEVSRPIDAALTPATTPAPDPVIEARRAAWQRRLDETLGEAIGFTSSGIEQRSSEMGRWVANAWRHELGTDVAVVNEGALRQSVPKGPITKATVYSVLPFDNKLVICTITGKDLMDALSNQETITSGLVRSPAGGYALTSGAAIEPNRRYTVATIDFLYYGGSGFMFKKQDPRPKETGLDWRTPVIEWTKRQQTTPEAPLERWLQP
jgi:2',3'-cyclic-nucleotide 2'-phosphodiesterase (5'-nucleotidase family)